MSKARAGELAVCGGGQVYVTRELDSSSPRPRRSVSFGADNGIRWQSETSVAAGSTRDALSLRLDFPFSSNQAFFRNSGEVKGEAQGTKPRPFHVNIPEATIKHLLNRVRDTRWPNRLEAMDWSYGASWDYMKALAQYWTTRYDWRKAEASLNGYPQFLARVGDFDIHFYHVRGKGPNPVPLILTHGWPGSVLEYLEAIGPLSDPQRFGGSPEDSFDVVVPSVPGFGFSSKPSKPIGAPTTATLWHRLMTDVLGYSKYGAQGVRPGEALSLRNWPGNTRSHSLGFTSTGEEDRHLPKRNRPKRNAPGCAPWPLPLRRRKGTTSMNSSTSPRPSRSHSPITRSAPRPG